MLLPRTYLPLHIFEPRYRLMIGQILESGGEFGVILARESGLAPAGCTAIVEKVINRYPDGRLDILTAGRRRFEVRRLNDEQEYLRAEVDFFDDLEPARGFPPSLREAAIGGWKQAHLAEPGAARFEPRWDDTQLSFQLAQHAPDLDLKQQLLELREEGARLRRLAAYFPELAAQRVRTNHGRRVAPRNGHGHMPPEALEGT